MALVMTREQFAEIAEFIGLTEENIRYDYSGRYMYGKTCPGIVLDRGLDLNLLSLGVAIAEVFAVGDPGEEDEEFLPDFSFSYDLAQSARTDSMGLGTIVYWPNVELTD